ncbi:MAG: hypothetical protein SGARI_006895, partial [Bacillariaceae sp.]
MGSVLSLSLLPSCQEWSHPKQDDENAADLDPSLTLFENGASDDVMNFSRGYLTSIHELQSRMFTPLIFCDNNKLTQTITIKSSTMARNEDENMYESGEEEYHSESIATAPSLYLRPAYFRQTRKGKIVKNLSERYLRDDLGLGCYYVDEGNKSNRRAKEATNAKPRTIENASQLLSLLKPCKSNAVVVCDTNVLLHNLDILEQSQKVMPNLVFPQTALVECRHNRRVAYDRSVELMRQVGGERF